MPRRGFEVLPRRWVVERTFAWLCHNRRMSKDYERLCATAEAFVYDVAMTRLMVRRLACALEFLNSLSETVCKVSGTSQPSHHEPGHRRVDERLAGSAQSLVVLAHAPVLRKPREKVRSITQRRGKGSKPPTWKQLLPVDVPTLLRPLLCPDPCDLLRCWLGRAMHNLDT